MVTNPYAIKKKVVTSSTDTTTVGAVAVNTTTTTTTRPLHHHHHHHHEDSNNNNTIHSLVPSQPQPSTVTDAIRLPLPKYTTFSQAFVDTTEEDDDDHHDDHHTTAVSITNTTTTTTAENTIANGTTTTTNTTTTNTTNNHHNSSAFTNDRDFHVLQQQPHVLYVSTKQHGNPILQYIRNVPFTYTRMVPDYIFSNTSCAIYLSGKYHILYRNYIHTRIAALKTDFTCRVLLLYMDIDDTEKILHEINLLCVQHNMTLILGWSEMEMARYIETFKVLQHRDASSLQKNKDASHMSLVDQMIDVLLSTSSNHSHTKSTKLNKTDAASLITQFQTMQQILQATTDELSLIVGLGPIKVQRLYDTFHQPFSTQLARQRRQQRQLQQQQPSKLLPPLKSPPPPPQTDHDMRNEPGEG